MKKIKLVVILFLIIFIIALSFSCAYALYNQRIYPEGGIWYCKELQIYINFDYDGMSKAIVDGKEIDCRACYFDASTLITINRVHNGVAYDNQREFAGLFVSLKGNELVLCDRDTKVEYTFVKMEE